jgi:hypothetical protein
MANKNIDYKSVLLCFVFVIMMFVFLSNRFDGSTDDNQSKESLGDLAITYYINNYDRDIDPNTLEAEVRSYGCHYEVHIYQETQLIKKLRWLNEFNANSFQ